MLNEEFPRSVFTPYEREHALDMEVDDSLPSPTASKQSEVDPAPATEAPDGLPETTTACSPAEATNAGLDAAVDAEGLTMDDYPVAFPEERVDVTAPTDQVGPEPTSAPPSLPAPARSLVTANKRLKFTNAGDLLSRAIQPQRWVWDGWVPRPKVGLVAAVSDHGKTALLLQLAAGVAAGQSVLGIPTTSSPSGVLFYSLEDDGDDVQRRLNMVMDGMATQGNLSKEGRKNIHKNFVFAEPSHDDEDLRFESTEMELRDQLAAMRVAGIVPALVIVETLTAVSDGDENRTGTTRGLWAAARSIAALEDVTVLISHHYRKDAGGGRSSRSGVAERLGEDSLRGAGANGASARFVIQMGLPTAREAEDLGLDTMKALNKGYAIIRASKLKAAKPSMIFVERVDFGQPGAHTWAVHPDSDQIIADLLKSKTKAEAMDLQDLLLLTIHRQGADPDREKLKAIFVGSTNPAKDLTNALNRLRQRGDILPKVLTLTTQGIARATSLAQDMPEEDEGEEPAGAYD